MSLEFKEVTVEIEEDQVVNNVTLEVPKGELHALMGPNGSGKSTLCETAMGVNTGEQTGGSINLDGERIDNLEISERAKKGLFLGFQYPKEVKGVSLGSMLKESFDERHPNESLSPTEFEEDLRKQAEKLGIDQEFIERDVNDGFSGGEKKRSELLQMAVLKPKYALLDEIDSGLDIDALEKVAEGLNQLATEDRGILIVTHYRRILDYLNPDKVHVMKDGELVKSGGQKIVDELEEEGYKQI